MSRWERIKSRPVGRLLIVTFYLWLFFMLITGLPLYLFAGAGLSGFVGVTAIFLFIIALGYLIPRVSNWVEYRKWDARSDHFGDGDR